MNGHGRQHGQLRPDWCNNWADLACDECGATWVGPIDEPCTYCEIAIEKLRAWQAELVLQAPDIDPHDDRRPAAVRAWGNASPSP